MHRTRIGISQSVQADAVFRREGDRDISRRGECESAILLVYQERTFLFKSFLKEQSYAIKLLSLLFRRRMKIHRTSMDWPTTCIETC